MDTKVYESHFFYPTPKEKSILIRKPVSHANEENLVHTGWIIGRALLERNHARAQRSRIDDDRAVALQYRVGS